MWITNGGFADVFIVFAKVDNAAASKSDAKRGDARDGLFSAFIVERAFGGLTSGKEEHKMGLHGSSTTPIILQDVRVPAGNLLGEIGNGSMSSSLLPEPVRGLAAGVTAIAASDHSCAATDGGQRCWGPNAFGQLGDGTTQDRTSPVAAVGL